MHAPAPREIVTRDAVMLECVRQVNLSRLRWRCERLPERVRFPPGSQAPQSYRG